MKTPDLHIFFLTCFGISGNMPGKRGGVIADLGTGHGVQPFKFGGKELMTTNGLNEYDFGARQYWHAVPGFNRIDPLCEKYYWLSPYLYCGNDPVNMTDMTGMVWDDERLIDKLREKVKDRIASLQKDIDSQNRKISEKSGKWSDKRIARENEKVEDKRSQQQYLTRSLKDIETLGDDEEHTYILKTIPEGGAHYVRKRDDGKISIETSDPSLSLHEITHVRQSL